jgi:hypothetical protein
MLLPQQKKKKLGSVDDVPLRTRTPDEETVDGRIRNREAISRIRDAWIFQQIRQRQPEFTQYRSVSRAPVQLFCSVLHSESAIGVVARQ